MSSTFNLLTAGGARFDKRKFQHDHDLFKSPKDRSAPQVKPQSTSKGKGKAAVPTQAQIVQPMTSRDVDDQSEEEDESGSDAESSTSSSSSTTSVQRQAPPAQKITITGPDPLPTSLSTSFTSLISHPNHTLSSASGRPLLRALQQSGLTSLWGVQCSVAGCLLADKDVLCVAPTGSGKTLAYVLPTLVMLQDPARSLGKGKMSGVRAVVVVPTHDLGKQIYGVAKAVTAGRSWRVILMSRATEHAVCQSSPGIMFGKAGGKRASGSGGLENIDIQDEDDDDEEGEDDEEDAERGSESEGDEEYEIDRVADGSESTKGKSAGGLGIDILISTPERLHHLVESEQLSLSHTRHIILDESDRLLSPDFLHQVEPIVKACPDSAQKCLLSATMPAGSEEIARTWMKQGGVRVVVGVKDSAVTTVAQSLLYTSTESGKLLALRQLLSTGKLPYPSLIFVQSIQRAEDLYKQLMLEEGGGVRVGMVHGGRTVSKRDEAVKGFREGKVWVLVVTEVLARGMDFGGVKVVINYDFPQTVQSYVHRIGRTGRAGRPGQAITFFSNEDRPYLRTYSIANVLAASGCPVPQYMLDLPKPTKDLKRHWAKAPVKRKEVGGVGRDLAKEEWRKKSEMRKGSKRRKMKDQAASELLAE